MHRTGHSTPATTIQHTKQLAMKLAHYSELFYSARNHMQQYVVWHSWRWA